MGRYPNLGHSALDVRPLQHSFCKLVASHVTQDTEKNKHTNRKVHLRWRDASARCRARTAVSLRRYSRKVRVSAVVHSRSHSLSHSLSALGRSSYPPLVLRLLFLPPLFLPAEVCRPFDLVFDFRDEIAEDGSEAGHILSVTRHNVAESVIIHDCAARFADVEQGDCRGKEGVVAAEDVKGRDVDARADFVV